MANTIWALQVFSTVAMVGLIWFVQIVHYPLFGEVGSEQFVRYESSHQQRTTWVVAPLMLTELSTAVLLIWLRPVAITGMSVAFGLALLVLVWISTACLQVPAHARLATAFDSGSHRWLVQSNWLRTIAWTARGILVCGVGTPMLR